MVNLKRIVGQEWRGRGAGASTGTPYRTLLEASEMVKTGLPFAAITRFHRNSGFTLERIKQITRMSEGSFARRRRSARLSQEESERLLRIGRTFERAVHLYDGDRDAAREWLDSPIPALGMQRPLDLAQTEPGAREVEDLIGRIEHGVVS